MKAILATSYGPPEALELLETATPVPTDNEVLVRVHASSVNALDWRPFNFPLFVRRLIGRGFRRPKTLSCGADIAGRVEAVGVNVTRFRPGDEVFGHARGAFAEYVCATEDRLAPKPAHVSFEAAAAVPVAGLTALQAVRDHGHVRPGQKVLINGAGGGVGTFAVQIAKALGAEVTAVCGSGSQDVARSIGADHVVDYTREDITRGARRYDVIVAANGYHSILAYRRVLNTNGVYVVLGGSMAQLFQQLLLGPLLSRLGNRRFLGMMTRPSQRDLLALKELLETGKIAPVIDRRYPLAAIGDAITYLRAGHARGKVVIDTCHRPD
jgi:NADPH:quinone reductase-like Zn-dependent oxidoreductase